MALPVNGSTHLIPAYYSFYRPRKDERLSFPSWLTYSGWLTHISGHPSAAGRAQDRESSPARDRRSTTVPRHQLSYMDPYLIHGSLGPRESAPPPNGNSIDSVVFTVVTNTKTHRQTDHATLSEAIGRIYAMYTM